MSAALASSVCVDLGPEAARLYTPAEAIGLAREILRLFSWGAMACRLPPHAITTALACECGVPYDVRMYARVLNWLPVGAREAWRAARLYLDAWLERDPKRRAELLELSVAADVRMNVRGEALAGRAVLADSIDEFFTDPRRLGVVLTSEIQASGSKLRFRTATVLPDGRSIVELLHAGVLDRDHRVGVLYTFVDPLGAADPHSIPARAAQCLLDACCTSDMTARRALLVECFAIGGRLHLDRVFRGRDEVARMLGVFHRKPGQTAIRRTSVIETMGAAFRFDASLSIGGSALVRHMLVVGEVGDDGAIANVHVFCGRLRTGRLVFPLL